MTIAVGNVTTSATTIYTSSGNSAVTWCSITNYSATDALVSIYVVPNGSTAANTNIAISSLTITANDTYQLYAGSEKLLLGNGDFISVTANATNRITTVTSYTSV